MEPHDQRCCSERLARQRKLLPERASLLRTEAFEPLALDRMTTTLALLVKCWRDGACGADRRLLGLINLSIHLEAGGSMIRRSHLPVALLTAASALLYAFADAPVPSQGVSTGPGGLVDTNEVSASPHWTPPMDASWQLMFQRAPR